MRRATYSFVKRAADIAASVVGLALTAPLQLVIAALVRVRLGSPVLFRQERPGKDARIFALVKFRTMLEPDPAKGLTSDEERLTSLGRVLRSTSLDELPTLWNVLRGDMSLVGPRPLLPEYLSLYTPRQALRHKVRPGVTGLAQVSGRNGLGWDDRLELDARYVEEYGIRLDSQIILATFSAVLRRRGITQEGHATMSPFTGSTGSGDAS